MTSPSLHPTGLVPGATAAQVLDFMHTHDLSLNSLAAAADVVAADCRFNAWCADMKYGDSDPPGTSRRAEALLDCCDLADKRCRAAMAAFASGGSQDAFQREMTAVAALLNDRS